MHPATRLESSLLWSTIVRITESFLTLANLVQLLLNGEAITKIDTLEKKREFRETVKCALNAIAQEIYSLEPLIKSKASERTGHAFQEEILKLFNHRLEQAPVAPKEAAVSALCPEGTSLFSNPPLGYKDVKTLSSPSSNPKKRRRTSNGRGSQRPKRRRLTYGRRNNSRRGRRPRPNRRDNGDKENTRPTPISALNNRGTPTKTGRNPKA